MTKSFDIYRNGVYLCSFREEYVYADLNDLRCEMRMDRVEWDMDYMEIHITNFPF